MLLIKIMTFIFIFILSSSVYAESLTVQYNRKLFTIDYGGDDILLKGHLLNLSIIKSKCTSNIINRFNVKMKMLLRTKPLFQSKGKSDIVLKIGQNKYFESSKSKVGNSILKIPTEVQRMKFEEKLKCKRI